jgi:hypothetical protein
MKHFRLNISLKVFVLILFTLEFLAPTMLAEFTPDDNVLKKSLLVNSGLYRNPLFSVFSEELCENEETKEFARATAVPSTLLSQDHSRLFESDPFNSIASSTSLLHPHTHPRFFLLQHKLLI